MNSDIVVSKWETIKLGEIVEYGKEKINIDLINHTNYISTENMIENFGGITLASSLPSQKTTSRFQKYDVLFSNIRTYFKKVWLAQFDGGCSNDVLVIRPKNNRLDNRYLYYILTSESLTAHSVQTAKGTKMPRGDKQALLNYEINLPSLPEQQKIADILSTIDDKIALNREMNKTLEAMAQGIFKSWFVDFEPFQEGEFVESELGMIPQGWEVKPLTEDFVITMGQSPDGKTYNENGEGIPFFQGRTDFGFRFPSNRIYCTDPKRYAKKFDTLVSVRAPVGDMNIAINDCCIGRGLSAVRHKNGYYSFTYYLLKSIDEKFKQFEHNGTVFGSINKTSFENLKVIIPIESLIFDFEKIVNAIDDQIYTLSGEIQTLSTLRDTLLPKLLSGKIKLSEGENIAD